MGSLEVSILRGPRPFSLGGSPVLRKSLRFSKSQFESSEEITAMHMRNVDQNKAFVAILVDLVTALLAK